MNIFDPTQVSGPKKIIKVPKRGLKGGQKRWKCTFKGKNLIVVLSSTHLNTGDFHLCITSENINFFDPSEVTRPKNITKLSKIRLKGGQKHEDVHPKGKNCIVVLSSTHRNTQDWELCITLEKRKFFAPSQATGLKKHYRSVQNEAEGGGGKKT